MTDPTDLIAPNLYENGSERGRSQVLLFRTLVAALALILIMGTLWLLGGSALIVDVWHGHWPRPDARIYVEPPQIYTRERLVNDRFREINWLEKRLADSKSVAVRPPSVYSTRVTDSSADIRAGKGESRQPEGGLADANNSYSTGIDELDAFNLDLERRVAMRSELLNTILDDHHDLAGATLYRMNFDVSVIPRPSARGFGLVEIDVKPYHICDITPECDASREDPNCLIKYNCLEEQVRAYRHLLGSWEQDLSEVLSKVYRDRIRLFMEERGDPFGGSPKERMAFTWYLKAKTAEIWLSFVAGSDDPACNCDDGQTREEQGTAAPRKTDCWDCDSSIRRSGLRSSLGLLGSDTLLSGNLPAKLERTFSDEIKAHSNTFRKELQRIELAQFRSRFEAAIQSCPKPPKEKLADEKGCGSSPKPSNLDNTLAQMSLALALVLTKEDKVCFGEKSKSCDPTELYERITRSQACSGPISLPWDPKNLISIHCPPALSEELISLRGILRFATWMRKLYDQPIGTGANPPQPEPAISQFIDGYLCQQEDGEPCLWQTIIKKKCPATDGTLRRQTKPPDSHDEAAAFNQWFGEFLIDRLRRNDIPGFHPSPSVDRFFSVRLTGCDTGSCNVVVDRRRWLSWEDWQEIGKIVKPQLCCPGNPVNEKWLQAILPSTYHLCRSGDTDCASVLCSSLEVAMNYKPERRTLHDVASRSNADEFRVLLKEQQRPNDPLDQHQRIAWDFATTLTALALKQRLDAIGSGISVYAVEPRSKSLVDQEVAQQTQQLRASLQSGAPGVQDLRMDSAHAVAERMEQITARTTVIGFSHLRNSEKGEPFETLRRNGSFGWVFLPNRFGPRGWLSSGGDSHEPATHRLSVVLSIPSWWSKVELTVRQCWGRYGLVDRSLPLNPYDAKPQCDVEKRHPGMVPAGDSTYPIQLPASSERISEMFDFEVIKVPYVLHRERPHEVAAVEAGRAGKVIIQGGRLWRGTMVTLDDQQADEIAVLPDMKGVVATFNCVLPPAGFRHFTRNDRVETPPQAKDPGDGSKDAELRIWTAQGTAHTRAVIWPFRQRVLGERPCWIPETEPSLSPVGTIPDRAEPAGATENKT